MEVAGATTVIVADDTLTAELSDGRTISVPPGRAWSRAVRAYGP